MKHTNIVISVGALAGMIVGTVVAFGYFNPAQKEQVPTDTSSFEELRPPEETFNPVFERCAHCHQIGKGARNSTGPVLTGVIDRHAAATAYPYSAAMRESGLIWDEATLRAFIKNPHELIPKTRMAFAGLPDDKIEPLIAFIRSVRNDP